MRKSNKISFNIEALSSKSMEIFASLGIKNEYLPFDLRGFDIFYAGNVVHGVGVVNPSGGIEYVSDDLGRPSHSIGEKCHFKIYSKGKENRTESCCVFFDFLDYIAYIIISRIHMFGLPAAADCFILSSIKHYHKMVIETDLYSKILLFFPKNDFGRTMALSMKQRNPAHIINCDFYYGSSVSLFDFMKTIQA